MVPNFGYSDNIERGGEGEQKVNISHFAQPILLWEHYWGNVSTHFDSYCSRSLASAAKLYKSVAYIFLSYRSFYVILNKWAILQINCQSYSKGLLRADVCNTTDCFALDIDIPIRTIYEASQQAFWSWCSEHGNKLMKKVGMRNKNKMDGIRVGHKESRLKIL